MKNAKKILMVALALWMLAMPVVSALSADAEGEYIRYEILSPSELLALLDEEAHSEAELAFLDRYGDGERIYNAALPGELIGISGGTVSAGSYTTSYDGEEILWTPDGTPRLLEEDGVVEVDYRGALRLSREEANRLLNFAYGEALLAHGAEEEIAAYEDGLVRHEAYNQALAKYQSDLLAYNRYVEEKAQYDRDYAAYVENQQQWTTYNQKKALYDTYKEAKDRYDAELATYQAAKATYDAARIQYDTLTYPTYLRNQQKIATVMEPMESMFIRYGAWDGSAYGLSSTLEVGTLYQALQNEELVAMLLAYKDKICSATSLQPATFDGLKRTSDELNVILREYAEKREESAAAAFFYYQAHYAEIRDKFNYLYDRMTEILKPSVYSLMCAYVDAEYGELAPYKKWRIKNVVCQIYMVSQCIDDSSTRTVTWDFYADNGDAHPYYYSSLLNQSQILSDLNQSNPASLQWQEAPVEPVEPTAPVAPTAVAKPVAPLETLTKPNAPTVVAKPTEPTPVSRPTAPAREVYERVTRCADILAEWRAGTLTQRTEASSDVTVYLSQTLCRRYDPSTGEPVDSIYDENGDLTEDRELVAEEWHGPNKTYVLIGFRSDEDGLCHYPIYAAQDRVFRVTFRSEGQVIHTQSYAYGQTPAPTFVPEKAPTQTVVYEFASWEPALSPVREDTTYNARFTERERKYTVTFRMKEGDVVQYLSWQATPQEPTPSAQYRDGVYLYRFVGWDRVIAAVSGDVIYNAVYTKTVLVETPVDPPVNPPVNPPADSESGSGGSNEGGAESGSQPESGAPSGGNTNLIQNQNGYVVETDGSRLQIDALLELCQSQNKGLTFTFTEQGSNVEISRAAIGSLLSEGVAQIALLDGAFTAGRGVGVAFYDAGGTRIVPEGTVRLSLPYEGSGGRLYLRQYRADGSVVDLDDVEVVDGAVPVDVEGSTTYELIRKYTVTLQSAVNGTVSLNEFLFEAGEAIPLTVYPKAGYILNGITLENPATGEAQTFADVAGVTMPAYDAVLKVSFTERLYTVEFRFYGGSESKLYRMGETVTPPNIPISFVADGMFYTFLGWSKNIEAVTEDTVYEATYQIVPEAEMQGEGEGGAMGGVLRYWILPVAGIVLGVGGAVSAGVIVGVKLAKKRKNKKS